MKFSIRRICFYLFASFLYFFSSLNLWSVDPAYTRNQHQVSSKFSRSVGKLHAPIIKRSNLFIMLIEIFISANFWCVHKRSIYAEQRYLYTCAMKIIGKCLYMCARCWGISSAARKKKGKKFRLSRILSM